MYLDLTKKELHRRKFDGAEKIKNAELKITFKMTDDCNLRCTYCYECRKAHHHMTAQTADDALDAFFLQKKSFWKDYFMLDPFQQRINLDFFGGECSLMTDFMEEVCHHFEMLSAKYCPAFLKTYTLTMNTNLTTYYVGSKFRDFCLKHRDHINILGTLDGCKSFHDACRLYPDGHGSFDDAYRGFQQVVADGLHYVSPRLTVAPANVKHFHESFRFFADVLHINTFRWTFANEDIWDIDSAKEYRNQLKLIADDGLTDAYFNMNLWMLDLTMKNQPICANCGTNGMFVCFDWDGNIYNCFRYVQDSFEQDRPSMRLGNIYDGGITRKGTLRKLRGVDIKYKPECEKCPVGTCDICPAFIYEHTGKLNTPPMYNCWLNKAQFDVAYYYFLNRGKRLLEKKRNGTLTDKDRVYEFDGILLDGKTTDKGNSFDVGKPDSASDTAKCIV